jgi:hypothetical protein
LDGVSCPSLLSGGTAARTTGCINT